MLSRLRNVLVSHPKGGDGIVTIGEGTSFTTTNVLITRHPKPCYYTSTHVLGGPECDGDNAWGEESLDQGWLPGSEASGGPGIQLGELDSAA